MAIVDFNDRIREYGNMLSFLKHSTRKRNKRSTDADWGDVKNISKEDVRVATSDETHE